MVQHVLVPVDGSRASVRGLEYALTKHPDADITVLHVADPLETMYEAPGNHLNEWNEWYERARDRANGTFADAEALAEEYGVELTTETIVGRPARTIVDYAETHDIDQIIVGSHGRTESRVQLGSVADAVVQRSPVSVLVVR